MNKTRKDNKITSKKEEIKTKKQEEPISISELKEKYNVTPKNHWPVIIIIFLILCVGVYFGYNYYLNNLISSDKSLVKESITEPKVNQTIQEELTCEEEFAKLLPKSLFLTRQTGSDGDWIFNPLDNVFNNYTSGVPLLPQRNLFYAKTTQNKYIAREGISSKNYFKYISPNLLVEYNPILIDTGNPEEVITIKGIPMSLKDFTITDAQITKCLKI